MDITVTREQQRAVTNWLRGAREVRGLAALSQSQRLKAQSYNLALRRRLQSERTKTVAARTVLV